MTETMSIRLQSETKAKLDELAQRSKRSKSFLAAEAIAAYVESEEWQLGEIQGESINSMAAWRSSATPRWQNG